MVKNEKGGNKGKGLARKHVNASKFGGNLRTAKEKGEVYAVISKMFGNGMCMALCFDNVERLCIMRKKFKGRGKRDNMIDVGSWVLVGVRDFETKKGVDDKEKCDLLEVYNDNERERLKKNEPAFKNIFDKSRKDSEFENRNVQFVDSNTLKYNNMLNNKITQLDIEPQNRSFDYYPSSDEDDNSDSDSDSEQETSDPIQSSDSEEEENIIISKMNPLSNNDQINIDDI